MSNDSVVADHPERLGRLAQAFLRRRIGFGVDGGGRLVLVRPDSVVVDVGETRDSFDDALARIARFDEKEAARLSSCVLPAGGIVAVRVTGEQRPIGGEDRWSVEPVQRALDALRGTGLVAEPNHVVMGSQGIRGMPVGAEAHYAGSMIFTAEIVGTTIGDVLKTTSDPAPEPAWLPRPLAIAQRDAPQLLVLDTGLRTAGGQGNAVEHPYLTSAKVHSKWLRTGPDTIDDEDEFDDDSSHTLDFEAGHGTFITGIVQQICPDAVVHIAGALSSFGDGDVADVIAAFGVAVDRHAGPFDIVIMSLGGFMSDDDGEVFGRGIARLLGDGLCVAAAGNQSTSRPYFPAALPDVIGVGGLGEADRAWFTNFGGWVDACAPAIDVVSTFFVEQANTGLDDGDFTGWARWSGTSFAAPKVAAVIAQELYLNGGRPREIWKRLSDHKRYRFPDLGTVFNV